MLIILAEADVHCKNIRISTYVLWRVFHILTKPIPYTFLICIRKSTE